MENGDTPLHHAVRHGDLRSAARLLMAGADFGIKNAAGQLALSPEYAGHQTLHAIRQIYHREALNPLALEAFDPEVRKLAEQMQRDGIVKVNGLLTGKLLQQIQKDISAIVRSLKIGKLTGGSKYVHYDQREYWQKNHRSYVFNDPLRNSEALVEFCRTPLITESAKAYLGKQMHIKRVMGMRYLPSTSLDKQQFGWHHDMEDKQFKVMVLLTDIGPEDQYMAYIPGTHTLIHDYEHFLSNKITYEDCHLDASSVKEIHSTGKAGDIYFFDSNGMHRGTRSEGRMRDALFIEYTADNNWKNIWGTDIPDSLKEKIKNGDDNLLKEYVSVKPKWARAKERDQRKLPTWAESLEEPELWV